MKIALIYEFLTEQGGLEREIINHASFLREEGHDVIIFSAHKSKYIENLLNFKGTKIREISIIKTPFAWLNILLCILGINKINKFNPVIFISYSFPSNIIIRNSNAKKIFYINHFPHFLYLKGKDKLEWANTTERKVSALAGILFGSLLKRIDKNLVKSTDLNFTNSQFTKRQIDKLYNIQSIVSYPPIDPKIRLVKSKLKEKFVFTCGRIVPDKKYEWLIKSCALMKTRLPLYLAGQGNKNYIEKLKDLARRRNVKLVFLGKLQTEDLIKYYSSAEVFAFPTPKEDFGLVHAESITCGTPCVVWGDGSGPTEQIRDKVNGFYARPYNLNHFAKKLDLCIQKKFKITHHKEIINSSRRFSSKNAKKVFIEEIKKVMSK